MPEFKLPQAEDAERTVLGGIIVDPHSYEEVSEILRPAHFYRVAHQAIYTALTEMIECDVKIDFLTLKHHLQTAGQLEASGGVKYLSGLTDGMPRITNIGEWCQLILTAARRREAMALGHELLRSAAEEPSIDAVLDTHHQALMGLLSNGDGRNDVSMPEALKLAYADLDRWLSSKGVTGIPSSLPTIDKLTSGWQPGQLIVVAARPACGKSVMCGQMTITAATAGYKVRSYTLEMLPQQVALRALLSEADATKLDCRNPKYAQKVIEAYNRLSKLPITYDKRESPTVAQIQASAARQKRTNGLDLVVVDYLQRITFDERLENHVGIGRIVKALKSLARELEIPVLCACQLNRQAEHKAPSKAELAQSGQVETEADIIFALHPDQKLKKKDFPPYYMMCLKHRNGESRDVEITFEKRYARFVEVENNGNGGNQCQ